jgi:hypothetical protein
MASAKASGEAQAAAKEATEGLIPHLADEFATIAVYLEFVLREETHWGDSAEQVYSTIELLGLTLSQIRERYDYNCKHLGGEAKSFASPSEAAAKLSEAAATRKDTGA